MQEQENNEKKNKHMNAHTTVQMDGATNKCGATQVRAADRAGFIQVHHGWLAHEADGHAEPALHAPTVGAHLLVSHPAIEQVYTA